MSQVKSLSEILKIKDCNELVWELYTFLVDKKNSNDKLNEIEEAVYLLLNMLPDIEMEGFVDLFHQQYSLSECLVVENCLRQLELNNLADLFSEAKSIYINGNSNITQEEYEEISLIAFEETHDIRRFDEIGEIVLAKNSEIYELSDCLCKFIRANSEVLLKSSTQVDS